MVRRLSTGAARVGGRLRRRQRVHCTRPVDRPQLLSRLHARENRRLVFGAAVSAAMWRAIPLLRPLGLLARVPPVQAVLERCYKTFLRFRLRLQPLMRSQNLA